MLRRMRTLTASWLVALAACGCGRGSGGGGGGGSSIPPFSLHWSVALSDLTGDGKRDLVVTTAASVLVLLRDPAALGQFLAATNYLATGSDYISAAWIADMNGDGKADLVIAQGSGVVIRFQDPSRAGQFLAAVPIPN
jgi:hypothetical protein